MTGVADTVIKIFEPQRVATVRVDASQLRGIPDPSEYGTLTWVARPTWQRVTGASAAAGAAGFTPLAATWLPPDLASRRTLVDPWHYAVMSEAQATFRFDEDKARAAAAKVNATLPPMPASIAQTTLTMTGGPAVMQQYDGDITSATAVDRSALPPIVIVQAKAPLVTSDGASVQELRDYALVQPGIPPSVAAQIRAIGDPVRTLLLPVGLDVGSAKQVTVRGTTGYLFSDGTGIGTGLVWVENGYVFAIMASYSDAEVISLANGLR